MLEIAICAIVGIAIACVAQIFVGEYKSRKQAKAYQFKADVLREARDIAKAEASDSMITEMYSLKKELNKHIDSKLAEKDGEHE